MKTLDDASEILLQSLEEFFALLARRYNTTIGDELMEMTVRRIKPDESKASVNRLLVATSQWALSIRATARQVDCFILPATELLNLPEAELSSRNKLTLKGHDVEHGAWTLSEMIVTGDEMNALMRGLFKDVVSRTRSDIDGMPEPLRLIAGGYSFAGAIRSLVEEKHALVQKIVDQQESILSSVSRDLHDVVLGNIMLLKSSLSGGKPLPPEEMMSILGEMTRSLRDLCQDLSPRDLKDLGLKPLMEELCLTFSRRVGYPFNFDCPIELPDFPPEVALHIYRIAQESLNNVVKYAGATQVSISMKIEQEVLTMVIADNGNGFELSRPLTRPGEGGTGSGIIRERAELINCVYPARVFFDSRPDKGTRVTLEVTLVPVAN